MKRATLITTITGAILLVSFLLLSPKPSLEPTPLTHLGQPAEFWFAKIPVTIVGAGARGYMNVLGQEYGPTNLANVSGVAAFDAMGTNAVNYLLAKLEGTDSLPEKAVTSAATKARIESLPFRNAETERSQAVTALIDIKLLPPDARTRLEQLGSNSELKDVAVAAAYILKCRADGTKFPMPGQGP